MNPHIRQQGFPAQGPPHMMMSQGQMMNQQMNAQMNQQMNIQMNPQMNAGMPMMTRPMMAPGQMAGVRMGAPPPPSYNQALAHSSQPRAAGNPGIRNPGRPKQPSEKEKYFMQQQAKLKQFGRGSAAGSSLDPTKLIDSMFGAETAKPRQPKQKQVPAPTENVASSNDGFGDFLGNTGNAAGGDNTAAIVQSSSWTAPSEPRTNPVPDINTSATHAITSADVSAQLADDATSPTSKVPTKDISEMMLQSCDLQAPAKSQGFHRPTLKEINAGDRPHAGPHHHNVSQMARTWQPSDELTQLFSTEEIQSQRERAMAQQRAAKKGKGPGKGAVVRQAPAWLSDVNLLAPVYRHVLEACLVDNEISTDRLYPILMLSGLHKEVLGRLWNMCNKTMPGKLTVPELTHLLALIALVQNNIMVETVEILMQVPQCPAPILASPAVQTGAPAVIPQSQTTEQQISQPAVTHPGAGPEFQAAHIEVPATGSEMTANQMNGAGTQMPGQFPPAHTGNQPIDTGSSPAIHLNPAGPGMTGTGPSPIGFTSSTPATLTVTQLPSGGVTQLGTAHVVEEDDDFADFQAAAPSTTTVSSTISSHPMSPKSTYQGGVVKLPVVSDKVLAGSMTSEQLKASTVENFFGTCISDDSSETASPDDDYFDGYKSADSKPSDSTSQFSTDQSDGDDFKNFDNYLDEFNRKRDQADKESPLHRPIKLVNSSPQTSITSKTPPKIVMLPSATKQSKEQATVKQEKKPSTDPPQAGILPVPPPQATADVDDFADFHSAPPVAAGVTSATNASATPTKSATPIRDLIGDEDRYAALRTLDFSSVDIAEPPEPGLTSSNQNDVESSDDWADFEQSCVKEGDELEKADVGTEDALADTPVADFGADFQQGSWEGGETVSAGGDSDWADFQDSSASFSTSDITHSASSSTISQAAPDNASVPFGISQSASVPTFDISHNASSTTSNAEAEGNNTSSLVNIKKDTLNSSEILGLFKVKSDPVTNVKSRDDDSSVTHKPEMTTSDSVNRLHGIRQSSSSPDSLNLRVTPTISTMEDSDNFFAPPPMDDFAEDDNDEYTRGYDLDDIVKPEPQQKKKLFGVYGSNDNHIVEGHKKKASSIKSKSSDPHLQVESDMDNDSDSTSLKDYDMFKGKLSVGKTVEDSQSIASLEFVANKNLKVAKDDPETQSQSSMDSANFDIGPPANSENIPESKSIDSLDLKPDINTNANETLDNVTNVPEKAGTGQKTVNEGISSGMMPILGDRYSAIMPQQPSSSDKPAVEWQRCLQSCHKMIQQANNIFNSISSSDVCNEVMKTTQGTQYIEGVVEIYRIVNKITQSMQNTRIQSDKLTKSLKEIDIAWNNLTAFLVGGSFMPEPSSLNFNTDVHQMVPCGLCLLSVDIDTENQCGKLQYAGNQYHASCANFWINCVDSCLPALSVPQLL